MLKKLLLSIFMLLIFVHAEDVFGAVIINEIAWMGNVNSSSDEWIELYNSGTEDIDLSAWTLEAMDGSPIINIEEKSLIIPPVINAGGFFLLERTDDDSVFGIAADAIYVGSLSNGGEILVLKNSSGLEVDRIDGSDEWKINGSSEVIGNNTTNETAQIVNNSWLTALASPRAANSSQTAPTPESQSPDSSDGIEEVSVISSGPTNLPNVVANAGEDIIISLGEEIILDASESREAEEYTWYMGNGEIKKGKKIIHIYKSPGNYIVSLEARNGIIKSVDQLDVNVIAGKIIINEIFFPAPASPGRDGSASSSWIEFYNPSSLDIDLNAWALFVGDNSFYFKPYTIVRAGQFLVMGEELTGLSLKSNTTIQVNFPGGEKSDAISIGGIVTGMSAARSGDKFSWTSEASPGAINTFTSIPQKTIPKKESIIINNLEAEPPSEEVVSEKKEEGVEKSFEASIVKGYSESSAFKKIIPWLISVFSFSFSLGLFYVFWAKKKENY